MKSLAVRLSRLEGDGEFLTIGEILDRLECGEPIDRISLCIL